MITLNLKLSVLFIECEVKGALINPLSWASLGNTNVYPIIFEVNVMISDLKKKNWQGLPQGKAFLGAGKGTQDTPPPNGFTTRQRHSPSYSLMQQLNCCKRTEESTTLDPQWCHQSLPNCNPTCNAAWKDIHIPLLGCPPKWKFITTAKSYQHPTTTQVDPLNENWNMWKSRKK